MSCVWKCKNMWDLRFCRSLSHLWLLKFGLLERCCSLKLTNLLQTFWVLWLKYNVTLCCKMKVHSYKYCSKRNTLYFVSSESLTTVSWKIQVFWYMMLCQWMSVSECCTETWCIHILGLGNARWMPNMGDRRRKISILVWLMKARSNGQTQWGS